MPLLLWTILEILFGYWVFRNRRKIHRGINYLISPPPAQTEELPDTDENYIFMGAPVGAILGLVVSAAFLVAHALFFGRSMNSFSSAVYFCGIFGGALLLGYLSYRNHVYPLAPNQSWRVLTEKLAARAGISDIKVRAIRNKSLRIRVSPKGVVTLPSALLRNSTPDELAFHIGRALWEISSGYAKNQTNKISRSASLHIVVGALISAILTENIINLSPIIFAAFSFLFSVFYISIHLDKAIYAADRFALGLTGDFPAALRSIGPDKPRTESLSDWWVLQQRFSPPGTT